MGGEDEIKFDKIIIKRRRYPFLAEREEEIFRKLSMSHFPFPSFVSSFSSTEEARLHDSNKRCTWLDL